MTGWRCVSSCPFKLVLLLIVLMVADMPPSIAQPVPAEAANVSGLPLPRFVSISAARANLRKGPGRQYPVAWILQRRHLPVEVIGEFEHWRKIREISGETGWVHKSRLSGKRTGMVVSGAKPGELTPGYKDARKEKPVLLAEPGAIGEIRSCRGEWCVLRFEGREAWMPRESIWGVYPNEKID